MTGTEMKEALLCGLPAVFDGVQYDRITAIIYRKAPRGLKIQLELEDKNRNSVVIASPDKVTIGTIDAIERWIEKDER